ncbi:MAG: MBL fold metallo-hydrolase, partial [Candidatus Caldatribacteriaceae bacterium]
MWQIHTIGTQNYLYFPERKILLDCGPNKDQARKIKKLVGDVNFLILTHAHAD